MKKTDKLIRDYEKSCNKLIKKFCKKQKLEFEFWIGEKVGETACFTSQHSFNMNDIVLDLKTNQKKHNILNWQNENIERNAFTDNPQWINYRSYCMGLRFEDLK